MKKFVIGGAAVLATAGIGLGLTQLANADPNSPKPTESSSVSVASEQASNQQGGPTDGQRGGPGGGMVGLRGGAQPKKKKPKPNRCLQRSDFCNDRLKQHRSSFVSGDSSPCKNTGSKAIR